MAGAACPCWRSARAGTAERFPFRLLKTSDDDRTPIYGRPFKCKACRSRDVTLFAIDDHDELEAIQRANAGPRQPRHGANDA